MKDDGAVLALGVVAMFAGVAGLRGARPSRGSMGKPPPDALGPEDYPGIYGDPDRDGYPSADDPHPLIKGDTSSVQQVRIADEMTALLDARKQFVRAKNQTMAQLRKIAPKGATVYGRVKSPYSIINKLRRKRLKGPKGLTDIAGTMIVVRSQPAVDKLKARILRGALGQVVDHEDYYATPLSGYRAHHFIVQLPDGTPVEVQLKTQRMKAISDASHTPYKTGRMDDRVMGQLTTLAAKADRGSKAAAKKIDRLISQGQKAMTRKLTRQSR